MSFNQIQSVTDTFTCEMSEKKYLQMQYEEEIGQK